MTRTLRPKEAIRAMPRTKTTREDALADALEAAYSGGRTRSPEPDWEARARTLLRRLDRLDRGGTRHG